MASESIGTNVNSVTSRVILQQCLSARLMVQPATDTEEAKYVQIGRGLIVYVCFLKCANEDTVEKMVRSVLGARLSETEDGKLTSVLELPGDVLIIPQATLGGTLKGKCMQYHKNINKEMGEQLYNKFTQMCEAMMQKADSRSTDTRVVRYGTYGNRQVFSTETNGPYTHILDF